MTDPLHDDVLANLDQFLSHTIGWFHPRDIWNEYSIKSMEGKEILRNLLLGRIEDGELEHEGLKYRNINREMRELNWFDANEDDYVKMNLPFGLNEYLKLYSGVVVIAGESGKGKTAFMYDTIFRNIDPERPQYLFSNDMAEAEMKERFLAILESRHMALPDPASLKTYERFNNFGDVIVRDGINYVDYLDVNTDFYSIGQEFDDIHRATGRGITFVGLQKKVGEPMGIGALYSFKRAKVYITLGEPENKVAGEMWQGELIVRKSRGRVRKDVDPTGKRWYYNIRNGTQFLVENKE